MRLSVRQKQMLVRMLGQWWWPHDGRKAHGWNQTLWSLKRKGLVDYLQETEDRTAGWALTERGEELAHQLH